LAKDFVEYAILQTSQHVNLHILPSFFSTRHAYKDKSHQARGGFSPRLPERKTSPRWPAVIEGHTRIWNANLSSLWLPFCNEPLFIQSRKIHASGLTQGRIVEDWRKTVPTSLTSSQRKKLFNMSFLASAIFRQILTWNANISSCRVPLPVHHRTKNWSCKSECTILNLNTTPLLVYTANRTKLLAVVRFSMMLVGWKKQNRLSVVFAVPGRKSDEVGLLRSNMLTHLEQRPSLANSPLGTFLIRFVKSIDVLLTILFFDGVLTIFFLW